MALAPALGVTLKVTTLALLAATLCSTAAAQVPAASAAKPSSGALYDSDKATALFRQAADLGSGEAMFSLGVSYWAGRGVTEDWVEAYKWIDLAAVYASNREQETAVQARNALARVLTPAQIEDAKRRAREWQIGFERKRN